MSSPSPHDEIAERQVSKLWDADPRFRQHVIRRTTERVMERAMERAGIDPKLRPLLMTIVAEESGRSVPSQDVLRTYDEMERAMFKEKTRHISRDDLIELLRSAHRYYADRGWDRSPNMENPYRRLMREHGITFDDLYGGL